MSSDSNEVELSDEVLARRVFRQDLLELHTKCFMLGQTARFAKDKTVIDVGAACGMYTWYWSHVANRVFAYEPVPAIYEQLLKVAEKTDNVYVHNKAVGNYEGNSPFYVDDKRLSNNGFRNLVDGQPISVRCTKLDSNFEDVGFIKIDVEGNELDVLKGAERLIENCNPTLMIEIFPKFNDGPVSNTFQWCFDRDYTAFYNLNTSPGLRKIESMDHALDIVNDEVLGPQTDYDILFVHKKEFENG